MIKTEHLSDSVTLHLADCHDVPRELLRADALVSDPPYGKGERTNRLATGRSNNFGQAKSRADGWAKDWPPVKGDDKPFDPTPWLAYPKIILFGANWYCSRLPDASKWIVWDKREGTTPDDNADCELAWTNLGGPTRIHRQLWRGICRRGEENIAGGQGRVHPTQKPIELMTFCLQACRLNPGDTVLDPYMGAGATGVAAVRLGLNFIGVEWEPIYFDTACRRIAEAVRQPDMFIEKPARAKIAELDLTTGRP